jgi:GMC oxidoreductase/Transposase DDE domain group 1
MQDTSRRRLKIAVSADGKGIVTGAGGLLVAEVLRVTGLGRALWEGLARWRAERAIHDPGKIVSDLAVAVALGGDCLADIAVLRAEPGLHGPVASDPVVSRAVAAPGADGGLVTVDLDATLVTSYSEKENAAPTWKKTFGFHPLAAFADHGPEGGGEPLAILLHPGNAGSNTAADHIEVTRLALAQLPRGLLRRALVRADSGGGTHEFLAWLTRDDLNAQDQEGICWWDLNIVDGTRQSVADGYLRPVLDRANLTVVTTALVHLLIVADGRCAGVEYSVGGELRRVYPQSETIVSAGSIGSAQLLMLSGIGPAEHLSAVGVDVVVDLPGVGANLHDHGLAGVVYAAGQPVPAQTNHGEVVAAVRTDPDLAAPDVQLLVIDVPYHPPSMPGPANGYTIAFTALHPRSRGSVRLASADPAAAPLIDLSYFGDDRDMDAMLAALGIVRKIGSSPAFDDWRNQEALPGPEVQNETGLRDYLRKDTDTYHHPVGTCRIGTDPAAVVDPQSRVRGIDGLRVADASVMPAIPGANTNATVLAIAERAALLIGQ